MVSTIAHFSTGVGTVGYSTFVVAIFCFLQRQLDVERDNTSTKKT